MLGLKALKKKKKAKLLNMYLLCVFGNRHVNVEVRGQFSQELVLSFYHVSYGDRTQVIRLGGHLSLLTSFFPFLLWLQEASR